MVVYIKYPEWVNIYRDPNLMVAQATIWHLGKSGGRKRNDY